MRTLIRAQTLISLQGVAAKNGRHPKLEDLSIIPNAAIIFTQKGIEWIGSARKIPRQLKIHRDFEFKGDTLLPGFVDAHTHLVFAGHRADEFESRLQGVSYQQIAAQGGGIQSTMKATRAASAAHLFKLAQQRSCEHLRQGVSTIEVKSGYGLDLKSEIKILKLIHRLGPQRMVPTFLGAHALPPEFKTHPEYLEHLSRKVLPKVAQLNLARRVDIFVEKSFFEVPAARKYLRKAQQLGFDLVIHADQLSESGGSQLGLDLNAKSIDHAIFTPDSVLSKVAQSQTVALLLPLADLYMRCPYPRARKWLDSGARVALATDYNPGSAPSMDLQLAGLLARLEMQMSLPEVIAAWTYNGAAALGLNHEIGSLEIRKRPDIQVWSGDWRELFYSAGARRVRQLFIAGVPQLSS